MTPELILTAGFIVIAYAAVANRLFAFARALREDFLSSAEMVAADARVPIEHRRMVWNASARISSAATAWRAVLFLIAAIADSAVAWVRGPMHASAVEPFRIEELPEDLRRDYRRLIRASIVASLCTSPAALVTFGAIIAVASFAGGGFRLAEAVVSRLSSREASRNGDMCPPSPV